MARHTHQRHQSPDHASPTPFADSAAAHPQALYSLPLPRRDTAEAVARDIELVATRLDALSEKLHRALAD